jgi:hypothetical protein
MYLAEADAEQGFAMQQRFAENERLKAVYRLQAYTEVA